MKLYLHGHAYKYAAEQMLLTLFPAQRPEYPAGPPAPGEAAMQPPFEVVLLLRCKESDIE